MTNGSSRPELVIAPAVKPVLVAVTGALGQPAVIDRVAPTG